MKTITDSTDTPYSILIQGPPGGGKTTLALTFPDVFHINVDRNERGPIRKLKELGRFKPYVSATITHDDNGIAIADDKRFERVETVLAEVIAHKESKTIVLDTFSSLDDIYYQQCKRKANLGKHEVLSREHWRLFRQYVMMTINLLKDTNKNIIILMHEEINRDPKGVIESYTPALSSGLRDYWGGFFTDVWRMTGRPAAGDKQVYTLYALPTGQADLKNTWSLPAKLEDPTYDKLLAFMNLPPK